MRKLLISAILLILLPICGYAQTCMQPKTTNTQTNAQPTTTQQQIPNTINLLFVLTAKTAVLKANNDGSYTLTFFGVNPYITYFTNRPNRHQGLAAVEDFMKAWTVGSNNFQVNPPNAMLTAVRINNVENNNQQFYIFTLTSPKYNLKQNVMQFIARPITQKILFKDVRFDNATMVID
jgi:hypothetical protein